MREPPHDKPKTTTRLLRQEFLDEAMRIMISPQLRYEIDRLYLAVCLPLLLTTLFFFPLIAYAQVTGQGSLSGTVTDTSGSIVVGAQVTITNSETNVSQMSATNSTGYFEVDNLNPGTYSIQIVSQGFETLVRQGITLEADARLKVPLQLHPGGCDRRLPSAPTPRCSIPRARRRAKSYPPDRWKSCPMAATAPPGWR